MAGRAIRRDPGRDHGGRLPAGLGSTTTALATALRSPSRNGVPGWAGDDATRARVTGRPADPPLAVRPHGAAPAPHGGRRANAVDRCPGGSVGRRLASLGSPDGAGSDGG